MLKNWAFYDNWIIRFDSFNLLQISPSDIAKKFLLKLARDLDKMSK